MLDRACHGVYPHVWYLRWSILAQDEQHLVLQAATPVYSQYNDRHWDEAGCAFKFISVLSRVLGNQAICCKFCIFCVYNIYFALLSLGG